MAEDNPAPEHPELTDVVAYCAAIAPEWDYVPNPGNLGDSLIATGTFTAFARAGIVLNHSNDSPRGTKRPVLMAGGGNLVPYYDDVERALIALRDSDASRIVMLPHSIDGNEALLSSLDERFEIFCRERPSFHHVRQLHPGVVALDHDMATRIDPDSLFAEYEALVPFTSHKLLGLMERITTTAADLARRNKRHGRLFRRDVESARGPVTGDNMDLAGYGYGAWGSSGATPEVTRLMAATFLRAIALFDEIETDRLHVAIGGGLMGIPVRLHPNSYYKNASIHAMTVSRFYPSVQMAENS